MLAATLVPSGGPQTGRLFVTEWLADALLNVVLFLPLGAALAAGKSPLRRVLGLAALLAGAIELIQFVIPGRYPSPVDLVANSVGAVTGALLWRSAPRWSHPAPAAAPRLAAAAAAAAAAVLLLTGLLVGPQLPHSDYYAQWTPSLGHLEWYRGRVLQARLADEPFPPGLMRDQERVRRVLRDNPAFDVTAIAGPATSRPGSLVSIYDHLQREIVLLGPDRDDMVLRQRSRAAAVGLAQPAIRWRGVLRGVRTGDTVVVRLARVPRGHCLRVNTAESCVARYRASSGWTLLRRINHVSPGAERALGAAWLAALVLPAGFWARRQRARIVTLGLLAAAGAAVPLAGLAPLAWWEILGLAAGFGAGLLLGRGRPEESA